MRALYPGRAAWRDRSGSGGAARRPCARAHGHARTARARAEGGGSDDTDVLTWWGHIAHEEVDDAVVARVHDAVLLGMGLVVLHSGHYSKILRRLLGTTATCAGATPASASWSGRSSPRHPSPRAAEPDRDRGQEMYGEFFDIPAPDELVFISSFAGGEVFRGGRTLTRGNGPDFLLQPRRPGLSRLPPPGHQARARQRRAVGGAAAPPGARGQPGVAGGRVERAPRCASCCLVPGRAGQHHQGLRPRRRRVARGSPGSRRPNARSSPPSTGSSTTSRAGMTCSRSTASMP